MRIGLFSVIASILAWLVAAGPPVPGKGGDGWHAGPVDAPVQIDMFYDMMCPNCRDSWPAVKAAFQHFQKVGKPIRITLHTFPLPYHHNAYLVAQAAHALGDAAEENVWKWMEGIFAKQDKFGNAVTAQNTTVQVKRALVDLAKSLGLPGDVAAKGLDSIQADSDTRVSWKYACYRGVFGTPTYLINGVPTPEEAAAWSQSDWIKFIDQVAGWQNPLLVMVQASMS